MEDHTKYSMKEEDRVTTYSYKLTYESKVGLRVFGNFIVLWINHLTNLTLYASCIILQYVRELEF